MVGLGLGDLGQHAVEEVVGADAVAERVVGEHEAMSPSPYSAGLRVASASDTA